MLVVNYKIHNFMQNYAWIWHYKNTILLKLIGEKNDKWYYIIMEFWQSDLRSVLLKNMSDNALDSILSLL